MKKIVKNLMPAMYLMFIAFSAASCNQTQAAPAAPAGQPVDLMYAAEKALPSVVYIKSVTNSRVQTVEYSDPFEDFFSDPFGGFFGRGQGQGQGNGGKRQRQVQTPRRAAAGSGVIISADGYIVTNNHVVDGADELTVTLSENSKEYSARIIGSDNTTDLALIKIDAKDLPAITIANSDDVKVGEWVLAVGNPLGLNNTVTAGIVSAKARSMGSGVSSMIQTDAAINQGNSGGALVNTRGELIGINAAIASHTGSYEGYSFAIPSNIVRKVVDDLLMYGETQRAYLGVQIREMDANLAEEAGMHDIKGVYVAEASKDGAAEKAGIKSGDVIVDINGTGVNTTTQLMEAIRQYRPGDEVNVKVIRNGNERYFTVGLLNEVGSTEVVKRGESFFNDTFGLMLQPISQSEMKSLHVNSGLKIVEIRQGPFQGANVEGFIITDVNGKSVNTKNDLEKAIASNRGRKTYIGGVYPNGMRMNFEYYN